MCEDVVFDTVLINYYLMNAAAKNEQEGSKFYGVGVGWGGPGGGVGWGGRQTAEQMSPR